MIQPATLDPPPAASPSPPDAPDWDAVREEVRCPLCGYQLRGLTEPRCPECGYRFEWRPLLDPTARFHAYLFEHHPERSVRSFARTMIGALLPRRFWRSLHPAQPSRPRRLALYCIVSMLLALVVPLAVAARTMYLAAGEHATWRQRQIAAIKAELARPLYPDSWVAHEMRRTGSAQAVLESFERHLPRTWSGTWIADWLRRYDVAAALAVPVLYAAWLALTLATLLMFAASMRRAKVRPVHVARCAVYCCDAALWLTPLVTLAAFALARRVQFRGLLDRQVALLLAGPMLAAYTTYRLWAAYRLYMRFDRPFATALASQVVVTLLVIVALLNLRPI